MDICDSRVAFATQIRSHQNYTECQQKGHDNVPIMEQNHHVSEKFEHWKSSKSKNLCYRHLIWFEIDYDVEFQMMLLSLLLMKNF